MSLSTTNERKVECDAQRTLVTSEGAKWLFPRPRGPLSSQFAPTISIIPTSLVTSLRCASLLVLKEKAWYSSLQNILIVLFVVFLNQAVIEELQDDVKLNYTPTTLTCDQCVHHVVMDIILYVNNSKNKVLRESNYKRRDQQDVVITYSGIRLSQIFVSLNSYLH